jgi:hypothetical protein
MGAHKPAHAGQLLASQRRTEAPDRDTHCSFCGVEIVADAEEYVEHTRRTDDGKRERTEEYCSPSCFIREMERAGGI